MNSTLPIIRDVPPSELSTCLQWLLGQIRVERAQWIVAQLTDRVKHKQIADILAVEATSGGDVVSAAITVLVAPHAANLLAISGCSQTFQKRVKKTPDQIHAAVFKHLLARLRVLGVTFLQSSTDQDETAGNLRELGFERLADLTFLVLESDAFAAVPESNLNADWRFEVVGGDAQRLAVACDVAERSFIGTKDCPSLGDYRTPAEIVAGYQTATTFDPSLWRLLIVGAEPVGCLFLTRHPVADAESVELAGQAGAAIELSYMGLIPEYRGRGLGGTILAEAVHIARQQNAIRMVLAVDLDNTPAISLYRQFGWLDAAQESVWAMQITR